MRRARSRSIISSHTNYFVLAEANGVTPIVPLIGRILASEPRSNVTLVYGNRDASSVPCADELHDLKDRYLTRFALLFVLSREAADVELFSGRIDRAKVDALLDSWIDPATIDVAYVCGPQEMTQAAVASLAAHGVARENIETEDFEVGARSQARLSPGVEPPAAEIRASALLDGRRHAFTIAREGETILDAGLRQGIDLPFSCKGGVCSTCRVLLVEGAVEMETQYALEDDEIARGFILMCQSYPRTQTIAIDVDAQGGV